MPWKTVALKTSVKVLVKLEGFLELFPKHIHGRSGKCSGKILFIQPLADYFHVNVVYVNQNRVSLPTYKGTFVFAGILQKSIND